MYIISCSTPWHDKSALYDLQKSTNVDLNKQYTRMKMPETITMDIRVTYYRENFHLANVDKNNVDSWSCMHIKIFFPIPLFNIIKFPQTNLLKR